MQVFDVLVVLLDVIWELCQAILASSCDNLATRWSPRAPRWAKIAPKSANMSQHSAIFAPSWRHFGSIFIVFYEVFCNAHFFEAKPIQRNTFSNTAVAQLLQDGDKIAQHSPT